VDERIHQNGENVSVDLFVRLDGLTKARRGQFIAIALATDGHIGDNSRLPNVIKRAREGRYGFRSFNGNAEGSARSIPESVPAGWQLLPSNESLDRRAHRGILVRNRDSVSRQKVSARSVNMRHMFLVV